MAGPDQISARPAGGGEFSAAEFPGHLTAASAGECEHVVHHVGTASPLTLLGVDALRRAQVFLSVMRPSAVPPGSAEFIKCSGSTWVENLLQKRDENYKQL